MIKTPVRDGKDTSILDADGKQIAFAVFAEMPDMVQAINTATDKDRQIAVLTNLVTTIRVDHRYEQDCIHGRECLWCQDADKALAESQRIQEGENEK